MLGHRHFPSELIDAVFRCLVHARITTVVRRTGESVAKKCGCCVGKWNWNGEMRVKSLFQDEIAYQVADTDKNGTAQNFFRSPV